MPRSDRPWLVTGAAGFIGSHLCRRLVADGHEVVGIDNFDPYYDVALKRARIAALADLEAFRFAEVDIRDPTAVAAAFAIAGPEVVVHLAAQAGVRHSILDPMAYVDANVVGFMQVLEQCRHRGVRHLVYASSSSVYGAYSKTPFTTADPTGHPVSIYAATKRANELDGPQLRPPVRPPQHGAALLHRLRALGSARHGVLQVRRGDARRPPDHRLRRRDGGA